MTENASAKAITNIKWLSSVLRGLQTLSDELGDASDVHQYIASKRQELEAVHQEYKEFKEKLGSEKQAAEDAAATRLHEAVKKADEIIAEAGEHKQRIIAEVAEQKQKADDLHENAKEIRGGAQEKADTLINNAMVKAQKIEDVTNEKLVAMNIRIEKLVAQESQLLLAVSAAQGHLDDIVGKIADLKSKL